jgi:hypothetical protein
VFFRVRHADYRAISGLGVFELGQRVGVSPAKLAARVYLERAVFVRWLLLGSWLLLGRWAVHRTGKGLQM